MNIHVHTALPVKGADFSQTEARFHSLSKTDWKTYALVVASYLLIGIGIALACASVYFAATVHPMVLASPILPVVVGIWSLHSRGPQKLAVAPAASSPLLAGTKRPRSESLAIATQLPTKRRKTGDPLGLENAACNCWANAFFQFLANNPSYQKLLHSIEKEYAEKGATSRDAAQVYLRLRDLIQANRTYQYELKEATDRSVSEVDSQKLRLWLHKEKPEISTLAGDQEDPIAFLEKLHELSGQSLSLVSRTTNQLETGLRIEGEPTVDKGSIALRLGMDPEIPADFTTLFEGVFHQVDPNASLNGVPSQLETRKHFAHAPEGFLVQAQRFHATWNKEKQCLDTQKVTHPIDFPLKLTLDEAKSPNGVADYTLDSFIFHRGGNTINSGHYFSFVKKEDGKWWCLNDSVARVATEKEVEEHLPLAYIVHYAKA